MVARQAHNLKVVGSNPTLATLNMNSDLFKITLDTISLSAISCYKAIGMQDKYMADKIATQIMREVLNSSNLGFKIIIGEGELDQAPMLYNGEILGKGNVDYDIAVDPLDGTNLCAKAKNGAITTIAISQKDSIMKMPEVYMYKMASHLVHDKNILNINDSISNNLQNLSKYLKKNIADIGVCILERERHDDIVKAVIASGAKTYMITDGDVMGVLNTYYLSDKIHIYIGIGGSPEGVLSAAGIKSLGGFFQCKFIDDEDKYVGFFDKNKIYNENDLIAKDVIFAISFVTDSILNGIQKINDKYVVNSIIVNSLDKIENKITTCYPE